MVKDRTVSLVLPDPPPDRCFFWVKISASNAPGGYSEVLLWRMIPFEVLQKWTWYFDYRAALYKVQNPKKYVQITTNYEQLEAIDPIAYEKLMLSRKIRACKGKITEWTRKVEEAIALVKKKSPMFPFENEPTYTAAIKKLDAKKLELQAMQLKYEQLDKITISK